MWDKVFYKDCLLKVIFCSLGILGITGVFSQGWAAEGSMEEDSLLRKKERVSYVLRDKQGSYRAVDMAAYIAKQYHDRHKDSPTPLVLQKIIFYSNVECLIKKGRPLIQEPFEAWDYGSVVEPVYRQFPGPLNNPLRCSIKEIPREEFDGETQSMVGDVLGYYSLFDGAVLSHSQHLEKPWKDAHGRRRNSLISSESQLEFYKPYGGAATMLDHRDRITKLFTEMMTNPLADIDRCFQTFSTVLEHPSFWEQNLKHFLKEKPSQLYPFVKLPEQTVREALGAYLFFPKEMESLDDPEVVLYSRDRIGLCLAYSSSFKNPLAFYYLSFFFAHQASVLELEELEDQKESVTVQTYTDGTLKKAQDLFIKIRAAERRKDVSCVVFDNAGNASDSLDFYKALSSYLMDETKEALERFTINYEQSSMEGLFGILNSFYMALLDEDNRLSILTRIIDEYPEEASFIRNLALVFRAKLVDSDEERYTDYKTASENGNASGYFFRAKMKMDGFTPPDVEGEDTVSLFLKAGKLGMVSAYSELSDLYRVEEKLEDAVTILSEKTKYGDTTGYIEAGNLCLSLLQDPNRAEGFFKQAGDYGFLELGKVYSREAPTYKQRFLENRMKFLEKLYRISTGVDR